MQSQSQYVVDYSPVLGLLQLGSKQNHTALEAQVDQNIPFSKMKRGRQQRNLLNGA